MDSNGQATEKLAVENIIEKISLGQACAKAHHYSTDYLLNESYSLLTRLDQLKPFSMTMPMVIGAAVSDKAMKAVTWLLEKGKRNLRKHLYQFIENLKRGAHSDPKELQSEFTILKLRFNSILDQLDIFADVLSQRAEQDVGIWLSGLDALAEDGLSNTKDLFEPPSFMVYLDRGHGAAIRRARTRLPGGDLNPVAVIQIPRERMVGSGIASSLIHEVGHQAAALLNLVPTLTEAITLKTRNDTNIGWKYLKRWISEIVSDVWALGHLGVGATMGLMGVVTLPKYFQFRLDINDPHPAPYLRVQLSCAFGKKMFPCDQWDKLWDLWETFYPKRGLTKETLLALEEVERKINDFTGIVLNHSTREMKGKKLIDLFQINKITPAQLRQKYQLWKSKKISLNTMQPTLLFAMLGQAKFELVIDATEENQLLTKHLRRWAFLRN